MAAGGSATEPAAKTLLSHAPHACSEASPLSIWAATWAVYRPNERLRWALGKGVHASGQGSQDALTENLKGPPLRGWADWEERAGEATQAQGVRAHTPMPDAHNPLRADEVPACTNALHRDGHVSRRRVCTHTLKHTQGHTGPVTHGCGHTNTSPAAWGSGMANGLSRAGLGQLGSQGSRPPPCQPSGPAHSRQSCLRPPNPGWAPHYGNSHGPVCRASRGYVTGLRSRVHIWEGTGFRGEGPGRKRNWGSLRGCRHSLDLALGAEAGPVPAPRPPKIQMTNGCVCSGDRGGCAGAIDHPALGATQLCRLVPPSTPPPSRAPGLGGAPPRPLELRGSSCAPSSGRSPG